MNSRNYARTIAVAASPGAAYRALTSGFEHWWTTPDQPIEKVGDRARFGFPPRHGYWTFEARRLSANEHVELVCIEALHLHEGMPKEIEQEWLGTEAIWRIEDRDGQTAIHFEHMGLNPDLLCYDICEAGWDMFFVDSLKAYLDTGTGKPFRADETI